MQIVQVAADDDQAVATFHRIYAEVGFADNPAGFVEAPVEEIREVLSAPTARFSFTAFLGIEGGEPVASAWLAADIKDDLRLAHLTPRVPPAHRRRGHGTEMLQLIEERAGALGRTLFQATGVWDPSDGRDGATSGPVQFALKNGWRLGLINSRLRLALPIDAARAEAVVAERAARRRGYTARAWSGPVPDELLADWAALHSLLTEDAPHGDLEQQPEAIDPEAIRDDERILRTTKRIKFNAVAISPDGELAAFSSILVRINASTQAFQQGTIVRRDHRGHGLGALVKVEALRLLQHDRPDIPAVITENAEGNEHMLALNLALGCVPVLYAGDFQKDTATAPEI